MTCFNCGKDTPLEVWKVVFVKCVSNSCSEACGRECPNCQQRVGHTWLDGQKEWKESRFYKS